MREIHFPRRLTDLEHVRRLGGNSGGQAELRRGAENTLFVVKGEGEEGRFRPGHTAVEVDADRILTAAEAYAPPSRHYTDGRGNGYKVGLYLGDSSIPLGNLLSDRTWADTVRRVAGDTFPAHALLANWDAFANPDNIRALIKPDSKLKHFAVDTGGALERRARGALKEDKFGNFPLELWSMRSGRGMTPTAQQFLSDLNWPGVVDGMERLIGRRDKVLAAAGPDVSASNEPGRVAKLKNRLGVMEFATAVSRALFAKGVSPADIDTNLHRIVMDAATSGRSLPSVKDVVSTWRR